MDQQIERLSKWFKRFAEVECKDSSELYGTLAASISEDQELLQLAAEIPSGQPPPNLLLGAVHFLLLKGLPHELSWHYPSIEPAGNPNGSPVKPFRDFCLSRSAEITELLQTRRVQTNVIRRCSYLYPVFCKLASKTGLPLALFELGTSAGLHLLWDQYAYRYDDDGRLLGAPESPVLVEAEVRGQNRPEMMEYAPRVVHRAGTDINIIDLANDDERLWLRALIWPEHVERARNLEKAVALWKRNPALLFEGDGVELLPELAKEAPDDALLCVFHTHVANQFTEDQKSQFFLNLEAISENREVCHIYNNVYDRFLHVDSLSDRQTKELMRLETDPHGRWFVWGIQEAGGAG